MLEIRSLGKTYGTGEKATHAIADVSFSVDDGEFVCVVGPSGCGKTTLLKCVAGLLNPGSGEVLLRGSKVTSPPEEMALVFQEYGRSLMPWSSVWNNVLLPLRHKKLAAKERKKLVEEALAAVGLTRFSHHYPWQLSGGMQQRVAIARALAAHPALLLMDEPFGALDTHTKLEMHRTLLDIWERERQTVLFVTHDLGEALTLASRIILLSARPGRLKDDFEVPFPRPRDAVALRETAEFGRLYSHIWHSLGEEFRRRKAE